MRRLILGLCAVLGGCGDDDEMAASGLDGGALDASITPTQADAAVSSELDASLDAALDASFDAGSSLCSKYGGAAGVERAIKEYVVEELATDCTVGAHFTMLPADRLARFGDCLAFQAQELMGCPGVVYAGSRSPNGLPCRDMQAAHAGLGLSSADFDAVLTDVVSGLTKAGVAREDIDMLAPGLLGLEASIVTSPATLPTQTTCGDAGAERPDGGGA